MPRFMAECYWPGVRSETLVELGERVQRAALELAADEGAIRLAGLWLTPSDEVAYVVFVGDLEHVRAVCERAAVPYDRITEMVEVELPEAPAR